MTMMSITSLMNLFQIQFMAYALVIFFGCLATYGLTYYDAQVIVAANRTMLDGKYNHVKFDIT